MFKEKRFVGINLFYDAGVVVDKLNIPESVVKDKDSIHSGVGGSLLIGLSPNFGVNIMIAKALDPRDGSLGFGFDMALTF